VFERVEKARERVLGRVGRAKARERVLGRVGRSKARERVLGRVGRAKEEVPGRVQTVGKASEGVCGRAIGKAGGVLCVRRKDGLLILRLGIVGSRRRLAMSVRLLRMDGYVNVVKVNIVAL
jgi:hypothetical protein